jgi:hypothetical protein
LAGARLFLVGFAVSVTLLAASGTALGGHGAPGTGPDLDYFLEDEIYNPNGLSQSPVQLPGLNLNWLGLASNGEPYSICFEPVDPVAEWLAAVNAAVAEWEAALPQTQFDYDCADGD